MKFPQLPLAARFVFQGKTFVKTGPLVATPEDGGKPRIIPRWAEVGLLRDSPKPKAALASRQLDEGRVRVAFEAYHARCHALLDEACVDDHRRLSLQTLLDQAYAAFFDSLHG